MARLSLFISTQEQERRFPQLVRAQHQAAALSPGGGGAGNHTRPNPNRGGRGAHPSQGLIVRATRSYPMLSSFLPPSLRQ